MINRGSDSQQLVQRIATLAWLAIALGLAIQALIIAAQLIAGGEFPGIRVLANLAQGVTWSVVVCIGIAVATIIMRAPIPLAGVIGFVCAPLALGLARGAQRGVNELLGEPAAGGTTALVVIALIKACQYGFLGFMLARLVRQHVERAAPYLFLGLATGMVFGSISILASAITAREDGAALTMPELAGVTVNELLFPIGCAMVVFTVASIARLTPK